MLVWRQVDCTWSFMRKLFVALAFLSCLSCKKGVSQTSNTQSAEKSLYGTWILSESDTPSDMVIEGKKTTINYRTHFKIESSQITYIVYCDSPELGSASSTGTAPAAISSDTIKWERPIMLPSASWCDATFAAQTAPVSYHLVNDALQVEFDSPQGKVTMQRAK